ncbi:hypothetical protein CHUAL_013584 [Chamberlinius hualienensis]
MESSKSLEELLKQFTIKDLLTTVSKLDLFAAEFRESLTEYSNVKRKNDVLNVYLDYLQEADNDTVKGNLDLLYTYTRSARKTWTIYELINKNDSDNPGLNPVDIRNELRRLINENNLNSNVTMQTHDGAYWIRFHILDKTIGRRRTRSLKESITYIVHYSRTNCIAATGVTKWHSDVLFRALSTVFEFESHKQTALQDQKLEGLFQLFHDKNNPHFFPLNAVHIPLATVPEEAPKDGVNERILSLQKDDTVARQKYVETKFGTDERPAVKKLVYEVRTPFTGYEYAPRMRKYEKEMFKYRVVFEGPSVINGLAEMVAAGMAEHPLPKYLANVRTLGKTRFLIKPKSGTT